MSASDEHEYELGQLDVDLDVAERHRGSDHDQAERRWMIWGAVGAVVITTGFLGAISLGSPGEVHRAKASVGGTSRVAAALAAHAAVAENATQETTAAPAPQTTLARASTRSRTAAKATRQHSALAAATPSPVQRKTAAPTATTRPATVARPTPARAPDPLAGLPNVADIPEDAAAAPSNEPPVDFTHDANPFEEDDVEPETSASRSEDGDARNDAAGDDNERENASPDSEPDENKNDSNGSAPEDTGATPLEQAPAAAPPESDAADPSASAEPPTSPELF